MLQDKLERKKRKKEKRRHEEMLQYLENHPEIVIEDPNGDIEAQLTEILRQRDPSFRNLNLHKNENDGEGDGDANNNSSDEEENEKKYQHMFKSDKK